MQNEIYNANIMEHKALAQLYRTTTLQGRGFIPSHGKKCSNKELKMNINPKLQINTILFFRLIR